METVGVKEMSEMDMSTGMWKRRDTVANTLYPDNESLALTYFILPVLPYQITYLYGGVRGKNRFEAGVGLVSWMFLVRVMSDKASRE